MQRASKAQGAGADVDDGAAVMSVLLVEGELLTVLHAVEEIDLAGFRIRQLVDDVLDIRDRALEALVNLLQPSA